MSADYPAIASSWLPTFGDFLAAGDADGITSCFALEGYLWLSTRWKARIAAYLKDTLKAASVSDVKVDTRLHLTPQFVPAHIVVAYGTVGAPRIPSVPGAELFTAVNIHSSAYGGGKAFVGKRTLVVGAGNSAADVCQDLAFQGAKEVTMLQCSSMCVVSAEGVAQMAGMLWPSHVPTDIADLKVQAMPYLLVREIGEATTEYMWAAEKETHAGLREAGLSLTMGNDGSGQYPMIFERFGGYCKHDGLSRMTLNLFVPGLDFGVSKVIASGRVKIKQGVELARFTEKFAVFTDGSSLDIDAVIFATSFDSIRDTMRKVLVTKPVLSGESTRRASSPDVIAHLGIPGQLWYAAGDFGISRFYSKQLALEIKAIQLGLLTL